MRLHGVLGDEDFGVLLGEYQRLLGGLFAELGGHDIDYDGDTVVAAFASARDAALAAVAAQRAVAAHAWPRALTAEVSVGLDSGEAGRGPAAEQCARLCDTAEGGQIFLTAAIATLLEDEELGELSVRDVGEQQTRRTAQTVRAFELVFPPGKRAVAPTG